MSGFADTLLARYTTPLRAVWGTRWARAEGAVHDAALAALKGAVRLGFIDGAPSLSLPLHAADTGVARAPGESSESWRARIAGAWETWSWLGTRYGIAYAVGLLGLGTPAIVSWHSMPWDSDATRWARITVVFSGRVDAGSAIAGTSAAGGRLVQPIEALDSDEYEELLRTTLRQWINARDRVARVIVARGGARAGRAVAGIDRAASLPVVTLYGYRAGRPSTRAGRAVAGAFC